MYFVLMHLQFKVPVKTILQNNSQHYNVKNVLLKHISKTVNCEVLNCGVKQFFTIAIFRNAMSMFDVNKKK